MGRSIHNSLGLTVNLHRTGLQWSYCIIQTYLKGFLMSLMPSLLWSANHSCLSYLRSRQGNDVNP
jgi:hypothetical protein